MNKYLKINMSIYWVDFLTSLSLFVLFFTGGMLGYTFSFILSSVFLYRACAFTHEIAHQYNNPKINFFRKVWDYTAGFLMFQPALRFAKPHLAHHTSGIFGTEDDPQYPLIRSNIKLAFAIFILLPIALPIYNILVCFRIYKVEKLLYGKVHFSFEEREELYAKQSLYLLCLTYLVIILPQLLIPFYLVSVGAWFLSVLRIPMEHSLKRYKKTSTIKDQRLDSFTHESILYIPIQPLGLRYHKEHHLYPKVPYHNLAKLHYDPALSP